MADYYKIDLDSITATNEVEIDGEVLYLAKQMLASGILVRPLVVRQVGIDEFLLLSGDKEFAAAQQARIDSPHDWEMVPAFVLGRKDSKEVERAILAQVQAA